MAITDKIVTKERLAYFKSKLDTMLAAWTVKSVKRNGTTLTPDANGAVNVITTEVAIHNHEDPQGGMDKILDDINIRGGTTESGAVGGSISFYENMYDTDLITMHVEGSQVTDGVLHKSLTTKEYVDANGGKIDKIKVNGNEQTIDETDKSVNIAIPVTYNGSYSGASTGFRFYGMTNNPSGSDAQTEIHGTSSNEDYLELTHRELEPISGGTVDLFERQIATTAYVDKKAPSYIATDDDFSIKLYKDGTPHGHQTTISADSTEDRVIFTHQIVDSQGTTALQFTRELTTKDYVDSTFRTEAQVEAAIAAAQTGAFVKVDSYDDLPTEGAPGKIYLVPNSGSGRNVYDEYIWCVVAMVSGGGGGESPVYGYEKIGTTAVDLTGYVREEDLVEITTAEIDAMFA